MVINGNVTSLPKSEHTQPSFIRMRKGDIPRTIKTPRGYIVESVYPIKTKKGLFVPRGTGDTINVAASKYGVALKSVE